MGTKAMSDFQAWFDQYGCRMVGDPVDYARAAWDAALRIQESKIRDLMDEAMKPAVGSTVETYGWKEPHHRKD